MGDELLDTLEWKDFVMINKYSRDSSASEL